MRYVAAARKTRDSSACCRAAVYDIDAHVRHLRRLYPESANACCISTTPSTNYALRLSLLPDDGSSWDDVRTLQPSIANAATRSYVCHHHIQHQAMTLCLFVCSRTIAADEPPGLRLGVTRAARFCTVSENISSSMECFGLAKKLITVDTVLPSGIKADHRRSCASTLHNR